MDKSFKPIIVATDPEQEAWFKCVARARHEALIEACRIAYIQAYSDIRTGEGEIIAGFAPDSVIVAQAKHQAKLSYFDAVVHWGDDLHTLKRFVKDAYRYHEWSLMCQREFQQRQYWRGWIKHTAFKTIHESNLRYIKAQIKEHYSSDFKRWCKTHGA